MNHRAPVRLLLNSGISSVPASIAALPGVAQLKAILPIVSMICSLHCLDVDRSQGGRQG